MYTIYKDLFNVSDDVLNNIKSYTADGGPIFNNIDNDKKRIQYDVSGKLKREIETILQEYVDSLGYGGVVNDVVILKSLPFCKRQQTHCDYDKKILDNLNVEDYPYGMIVALDDNTRFIVYPDKNTKKYLRLNRGDILIFRGDLLHAGSEYYVQNIRLHAYIDVPKYKRLPNMTYYANEE